MIHNTRTSSNTAYNNIFGMLDKSDFLDDIEEVVVNFNNIWHTKN